MPAYFRLRQKPTSLISVCDLCGHDQFTVVATTDRLKRPLQSLVCHSCGLVSTNPRPSDEDVEKFYRDDYRQEYKQTFKPKLKHIYRAGRVALERLRYTLPLLRRDDQILDLGAGGGEFLFMLRGLGHFASGIEPNLGYGGMARDILGLPVQVSTYQHAEVRAGSQDVVTCFHVLEHLPHPVEALSIMASWLTENGLLLIEVPHVLSRCQWPHSRYHIGHLHHFSSSNLALAGQKAGLRAVDTFTSADGGNLMVVFRRIQGAPPTVQASIPGHMQRVRQHLREHTPLSHLLSFHPYLRPFQKLRQRADEQLTLAGMNDPHDVLDHLLNHAKRVQESWVASQARGELDLSASILDASGA
jgi:SAM-dependent methyltransferase